MSPIDDSRLKAPGQPPDRPRTAPRPPRNEGGRCASGGTSNSAAGVAYRPHGAHAERPASSTTIATRLLRSASAGSPLRRRQRHFQRSRNTRAWRRGEATQPTNRPRADPAVTRKSAPGGAGARRRTTRGGHSQTADRRTAGRIRMTSQHYKVQPTRSGARAVLALLVSPCIGLSRRCASTPSSKFTFPRSSTPRLSPTR